MEGSSPFRVYAMLAVVMLLWSGNAIVARAIHEDMPPFSLAFCRWAGALLILLPFAWQKLRGDRALVKRHWRAILLLGLVGVASFNALLYSGLQYTTASNAMLIQAAIPALVLLFGLLIFRDRPRPVQVAGVTMTALGVLVIVFQGRPEALLALSLGRGDALILSGVVAWSLYTALLRIAPPIHPLSFLAVTFAIGAAAMLPLAVLEWQSVPIRQTPAVIGGIAYVAVLPSLVAYFLFNRAVAEIGPASAGQMLSLQPLFGALLAALILAEPLRTYHFAGMLLITLGIVLGIVRPLLRRPYQ